VTVAGVVVDTPALAVDEVSLVALDGVALGARPRMILFHKPLAVQCTVGDQLGRVNLEDVAGHVLAQGLHPVGRLDADTDGLLLFSSDGALTQHLLHPRRAVERVYRAVVEGEPGPELVDRLGAGVETAEGVHVGVVRELTGSVVVLAVREGKHRMVRRMLNNAGAPVLELRRLSYGGLALGDLAAGQWRLPTALEREWVDQFTPT
jgi:23S rRNA pseudouridine2605 synthase